MTYNVFGGTLNLTQPTKTSNTDVDELVGKKTNVMDKKIIALTHFNLSCACYRYNICPHR